MWAEDDSEWVVKEEGHTHSFEEWKDILEEEAYFFNLLKEIDDMPGAELSDIDPDALSDDELVDVKEWQDAVDDYVTQLNEAANQCLWFQDHI